MTRSNDRDPLLKLEKLPWYKWRFGIMELIVMLIILNIVHTFAKGLPQSPYGGWIWFGFGALTTLCLQSYWKNAQKYCTPITHTFLTEKQARMWAQEPSSSLQASVDK